MKKIKKDTTLLLRINKQKKENLKAYAQKNNISVNEVIDKSIDSLLINNKENNTKDPIK